MLWTVYSPTEIVPLLPRLKALNTDILMNYDYNTINFIEADLLSFLDACYANGMKSYIDIRQFTGSTAYNSLMPDGSTNYAVIDKNIAAFKNHPALYGWYMNDESNATQYPSSLRETVYNYVKSQDPNPNHILFEVNYQIQTGAYDPKAHDAFGMEMYFYDSQYTGSLNSWQTKITNMLPQVSSETKLFPVMQSFTEPPSFPLIPTNGIINGWTMVKNAGWGNYGAAFFRDGPSISGDSFVLDTPSIASQVTQVFAERTTPQYAIINSIVLVRNGNQLTATAYDSLGNVRPAVFSWSVNNPSIATIDQTGLLTQVNGGIVSVTATDTQDVTKSQTLNVPVGIQTATSSTPITSQQQTSNYIKLGQYQLNSTTNTNQNKGYSIYQLGTTTLLDLNSILGNMSLPQTKTISFDLKNTGTVSTIYVLGSSINTTTKYSTDNTTFTPELIITLQSNTTQTIYWQVTPQLGDTQKQLKINPIYIQQKG